MNTNVWRDFQICISVPLRLVRACSIIFSTTSNIDGLQEGRGREGVEKLAAKYRQEIQKSFCRCSLTVI